MAGKKSSSTSTTTTQATDARMVAGDGAFVQGSGASWWNYADNSTQLTDGRTWADLSTYADNSSTDNSVSITDGRNWTDSSSWADSSTTDNSVSITDGRSWADNSSTSTSYSDGRSWADNSQAFTDSSSRYAYTDGSVRLSDASTTDNSQRTSLDWYAADNSDRSVTMQDDRSWLAYTTDDSDRSVTNYTSSYTGTDPGLVRLAELQSQLTGAAIGQQSDAVRALAGMGNDTIRAMGASVTGLFDRAGSNTAQAWSHTLDASQQLMADMLDRAGSTADTAGRLAQAAIASYQPADNKQADTSLRLGMLAAAAVAALVILPKLTK